MGTAQHQNGRAVQRPPAPSPRPSNRPVVAVVRQRSLPADAPLRAALHLLGLKAVPDSVRALHGLVGRLHPQPERSWSFELAAAYQVVFALVVTHAHSR